MIFDRDGRVVFRQEDLDYQRFVDTVHKKLRETLGGLLPGAASPFTGVANAKS